MEETISGAPTGFIWNAAVDECGCDKFSLKSLKDGNDVCILKPVADIKESYDQNSLK